MTARRGGTAGPRMHAARVLVAAPAMIGSLLLLLVLMSWAGRWEPVLLLAWLASAAAVFTPAGERVAVRWACGFVRPSARHRALLDPAWRQALDRCQVDSADVDLYIQRSRAVNAYAAGGRSVALTTGVQADFLTPRPIHASDTECVASLLAHELGHRASHGTRLGVVTAWLAAPWRFAERLMLGVAVAIAGRQPRRLLAGLVVVVVVVAVVQAVQHGQPTTAAVLTFLAIAGVACPLADAALRRHDEFAADRYAARVGYGPALAAALRRLDDGSEHRRRGLIERALAAAPLDRAASRRALRPGDREVLESGAGHSRPDCCTRTGRRDIVMRLRGRHRRAVVVALLALLAVAGAACRGEFGIRSATAEGAPSRAGPSSASAPARTVALATASERPLTWSAAARDLKRLLRLARRPYEAGYQRDCSAGQGCVFGPAWTDDQSSPEGHNGCLTRDDVSRASMTDVRLRTGSRCVVEAGVLRDPYTGAVIHFEKYDADAVEVNHVAALAYV